MTADEVKAIVEQFAKDNAHLVETQTPELMAVDWPTGYTEEKKQAAIDYNSRAIGHIIKIIESNYNLTKK